MARTDPAVLKQVRARVAAGAAFLDVLKPGWFDKIDLARLDLGDGDECVVGQLMGGWMLEKLAIDHVDPSILGFDTPGDFGHSGIEYDLLTRRWTKVIKERRALSVPF